MYFILQDLLEFPILKIEIEDDNPCSLEGSVECSVIFGQFLVLLYNGGTGKVKGTPIFSIF